MDGKAKKEGPEGPGPPRQGKFVLKWDRELAIENVKRSERREAPTGAGIIHLARAIAAHVPVIGNAPLSVMPPMGH